MNEYLVTETGRIIAYAQNSWGLFSAMDTARMLGEEVVKVGLTVVASLVAVV